MRYFNDLLTARLQYLVDNVNIEQHLDERFSQVYPTFDPNIHFAGMADDGTPKDAPLDSPIAMGASIPVLYPSIGYILGEDDDFVNEDIADSSTNAAHVDAYDEDDSASTEHPDDSFDDIPLSPVGDEHDGYGEGWGSSSDLPSLDGSAISLFDASTFVPTDEPPTYAASNAPPGYVGFEAPPTYPGQDAGGNNNPDRDAERGNTQRDEEDKEEHWDTATNKPFSNCNGNTFIDKQTLPILLKRPRRTLSAMSLKENMDTNKRRSARIAAMHVPDGYKV